MTATLEAPFRTVATTATMTATIPTHSRDARNHGSSPAERIVLTGFMGSGKTTIGRLLAAELGWEFLDLDSLIELRTGSTVPQIFAEKGEEAFRKQETLALATALRHMRAVIALGGGAPETLGNRLLLEQTPSTAVVFLAAPFATLEGRCSQQARDPRETCRPVFADRDVAEARFTARQPMYRRLAHAVIETGTETPQQTVARVLALVHAISLPE